MSPQGFKHRGEVSSIDVEGGVVLISMRSATACEGCHAKGHCTAGGGLDSSGGVRTMRVETGLVRDLEIGEIVEVSITYSIGFFAILIAYVLPLILFVAAIAVLVELGVEQGLAAGGSILIAALYYGVVYALRDKFEKIVHFEVSKLSGDFNTI